MITTQFYSWCQSNAEISAHKSKKKKEKQQTPLTPTGIQHSAKCSPVAC